MDLERLCRSDISAAPVNVDAAVSHENTHPNGNMTQALHNPAHILPGRYERDGEGRLVEVEPDQSCPELLFDNRR